MKWVGGKAFPDGMNLQPFPATRSANMPHEFFFKIRQKGHDAFRKLVVYLVPIIGIDIVYRAKRMIMSFKAYEDGIRLLPALAALCAVTAAITSCMIIQDEPLNYRIQIIKVSQNISDSLEKQTKYCRLDFKRIEIS